MTLSFSVCSYLGYLLIPAYYDWDFNKGIIAKSQKSLLDLINSVQRTGDNYLPYVCYIRSGSACSTTPGSTWSPCSLFSDCLCVYRTLKECIEQTVKTPRDLSWESRSGRGNGCRSDQR